MNFPYSPVVDVVAITIFVEKPWSSILKALYWALKVKWNSVVMWISESEMCNANNCTHFKVESTNILFPFVMKVALQYRHDIKLVNASSSSCFSHQRVLFLQVDASGVLIIRQVPSVSPQRRWHAARLVSWAVVDWQTVGVIWTRLQAVKLAASADSAVYGESGVACRYRVWSCVVISCCNTNHIIT